ncbi:Crp/Fnr family transcriptional regulator [Sphingomonas lacunae]|uniref:Crp/Fnr family transcriptional regulator n=1 Tax=Sphingomonas lacunae TaxID=2698828 RepID=A0A6M4AU54_9SPHN|nr:Crp/Fnr family transcriptional regulator [Sphingomonas lacunae]QJQ32615.1 Crp/Fnr family transcriptional regulator [Sphingomonas lacunae]
MKQEQRNLALDVLSASDWLRDYPTALVQQLVQEGRLVRLNAGEWAQAEGDDRSGLFVVIDGSLHSFCAAPGGRAVMIGVVAAGAVLGHATRYSGGPRLVTAVCVEPSLLLEVSETSLERVAMQFPEVWRAIAGFAYANTRRALQMAAEVISLKPRQRIAARLLAAIDGGGLEGTATLRVSQELLGEMLGLTRKTVNSHLSSFEKIGLVRSSYGQVKILNVDGLRTVANS